MAMGDATERGIVSRTARRGGFHFFSFFVRWIVWTAIIGAPAYFAGEWLWPHAYKLWGPPMGILQSQTYSAVLFGDLVSAVFGGAAVAFVGTFRR